MIKDANKLLQQLQGSGRHLDERVVSVIQHSQPMKYSGPVGPMGISDILPTWKFRAEYNRETDHSLIGAEDLIPLLQSKPPDHKIRQVSLTSKVAHCILVFDWASDEFLGYLLIRRRTAEEERMRNQKLNAIGIGTPAEEYVSA